MADVLIFDVADSPQTLRKCVVKFRACGSLCDLHNADHRHGMTLRGRSNRPCGSGGAKRLLSTLAT
jgi:hypothetical protein